MTDKSIQSIAGFTELEGLDLNYTSVGHQGLNLLSALANLKALGLDSTFGTDRSRDVFLYLRKLEERVARMQDHLG